MNTKKILIVTSDKEISGIVEISALTLTKLNCQVSMENASDYDSSIEKSQSANLDLIIIDHDNENTDSKELITDIRRDPGSKNKKIILLYTKSIDRDEIFKAGCDSIMSKDEFKKVVNNILVF